MIKAQTLKGFRDFLPEEETRRQLTVGKMKETFARFGFEPLETPALEYAETLLGKYGDEADKLLYLFKDNGKRNVGLRYDQTVPLSRVVAQYPELTKPFKRYQIQPVWRAENTQKGRFREFLQCDIDTVGSQSPLADAEIIDCALSSCKSLGFTGLTMLVNDRTIFDKLKLTKKEIIIIDKLSKIGKDAVIAELGRRDIFDALQEAKPTERLWKIFVTLKRMGYKEEVDFRFDPFLARGLDYYTSTIFELKTDRYPAGSLAGGGRYDNLIGQFTGISQPAVGIAFGFDRLMEAMVELNLLPKTHTRTTGSRHHFFGRTGRVVAHTRVNTSGTRHQRGIILGRGRKTRKTIEIRGSQRDSICGDSRAGGSGEKRGEVENHGDQRAGNTNRRRTG